ncbi:MAG: hypothetical protein KF746_10210 [Chitinophagaceae bacterium]|nr:hypothetical protein [Chitinophagaceae bacterium]
MRSNWLLLLFLFLTAAQYACKKDNPGSEPEQTELITPAQLHVTVDQEKSQAVITGKADSNVPVQLKYQGELGGLAQAGKTDAQGNFTLTIDLLNGYTQRLAVYTTSETNNEKVSAEALLSDIPPRERSLELTNDDIKQFLQAHRWKSDQNTSRLIIKQSNPTPPYDMFVLVAQKYFEFKESGAFYFTVTSPLQFTDEKGSWTINDQHILGISTTIPLGPMQINNIRIQELMQDKCRVIADIADGVFIISLIKE